MLGWPRFCAILVIAFSFVFGSVAFLGGKNALPALLAKAKALGIVQHGSPLPLCGNQAGYSILVTAKGQNWTIIDCGCDDNIDLAIPQTDTSGIWHIGVPEPLQKNPYEHYVPRTDKTAELLQNAFDSQR